MTPKQREHWECEILLQSSGELPEDRREALIEAVSQDKDLAELADFIGNDLTELPRAPRDFANEAIFASLGENQETVHTWNRRRWWTSAAALLTLSGLSFLLIRSGNNSNSDRKLAISNYPSEIETHTDNISIRGMQLEADLIDAQKVFKRSRYSDQEAL